jgi:hypothetical protein
MTDMVADVEEGCDSSFELDAEWLQGIRRAEKQRSEAQ